MEMSSSKRPEHRKEFIFDFSPAMPGNLREQAAGTRNKPICSQNNPKFLKYIPFFKKSLTGSIPVSRSSSPRRMP